MKRLSIATAVFAFTCLAAFASQQTGTLKGKIEDPKGKPIAGAEIRVLRQRNREVKETRTDSDGAYSFELEPDDYTISFDAEGFQGGTLVNMQQVEAGKETAVKTIRLDKAKKRTSLLRGSVFNSDGQSLAGAQVKLIRIATDDEAKEHKKPDSLSKSYTTNGRGEFAFRLPSVRARYRVTASAEGHKTETKTVDVNEDESVPLAFTLERVKK